MHTIYLNLPIRKVKETDTFFAALGSKKNPQFSSDDTTNAQINESLILMLLEDERFASFVDAYPDTVNNNMTIALQFETTQELDEFHQKALSVGGQDTTKSSLETESFLYGKSFRDINGHIWELFTFIAAMPQAKAD